MEDITYEELFAFLIKLGFEDRSRNKFERVFQSDEHGLSLAFAMLDDPSIHRPARGADITSVEFRLQHTGLLSGSLTSFVGQESQRSSD